MTDVHTPLVRSYNMSKIKGKNTRPEIMVRKFLHTNGFRFRLHDKRLPGKPDIILSKYKTIVFINGCFWHGHENCKYFVVPKTRTEWWKDKIVQNKKGDNENYAKLTEMGWKVITIFECKLKKEFRTNTLNELVADIY